MKPTYKDEREFSKGFHHGGKKGHMDIILIRPEKYISTEYLA